MPYFIIYGCALAALAVIWLPELFRRPDGRHAAGEPPRDGWTPRTEPSPAAPVQLRAPRYVPDVRPHGQLIREAYALTESRVSRHLATIAPWAA